MLYQFKHNEPNFGNSSKSQAEGKNQVFYKKACYFMASILFVVASSSLDMFSSHRQAAIATTVNAPNSQSPIGTNLAAPSYTSTELPFLDGFKTAYGWFTQSNSVWDTQEEAKLDLDQYGWVKSLPNNGATYNKVSVLMYREMQNKYPSGNYVVTYDGEGTITYNFDAKKIQSTPGRDIIFVDSTKGGGVLLSITSTDPNHTGNYIRNIHVTPANYETTFKSAPFNPSFISRMRKFRAFRFKDWMLTDNSTQQHWSDRPLPQTAFYSTKGVPLEVMVQLSNQTQAEPWFHMPHMADDDYITQFAQQVKASLSPNLKVYVEYSNEVWNSALGQGDWVQQQAIKEWPTSVPSGIVLSLDYTKRLNKYGERSAQICDIWKKVFNDQPGKERVLCVMAGQAANAAVVTQSLDCQLSSIKPCYQHGIHAVGLVDYFAWYVGDPDPKFSSQVEKWTLDDLFKEINVGGVLVGGPSGGALKLTKSFLDANAIVANQRNLKLIAYEGGQALAGVGGLENNQKITDLFIAANRDPRMYDAYTALLTDWKNTPGSELFVQFYDIGSFIKWGSWGSLEYVSQFNSKYSTPKYQSLTDFVNTNPCWWNNCLIPPLQ